ncbi:MAG: ATP-binding protein, partial [candidate division Zixibacteria bacterium]|nr:ATP-binding protein [candidate division Zixibacteria bacterium]
MHKKKEIILVGLSITILSVLHYVTPVDKPILHDLYRRLYYVPIIFSAFSFGLRGAMVSSLVISLVFLPHVFHRWGHIHLQTYDALFEIVLYNIVAWVSGTLVQAERKRREELKKAQEELIQANKYKVIGELAAGIAHEIRNPLGSIQGSLEILRKDYKVEDSKYEFLNILLKEVARLNKVITDFLNYARPALPNLIETDINQLISETVLILSSQAAKKGVGLKTELDKNLPRIKADPSQLKQAFINLILNSLEAIEGNGQVLISTLQDKNKVTVKFQDTGKGMSEETEENIFTPFFSTKENGAGLGLGTVERIVQNHKGEIKVESY